MAVSYYSAQFWKTCLQSESVCISPGDRIFQIATKYMGKNDIVGLILMHYAMCMCQGLGTGF